MTPALWSPDAATDVVIVEAADPSWSIHLPRDAVHLAASNNSSERNLVYGIGTVRLRMCVRHSPDRTVPALSIPLDAYGRLRLAAAERVQQAIRQGRIRPSVIDMPTPYQRLNFARLLIMHDALEAGVSSHELAFVLVFPNHPPLAGAAWKGSSERRQVLRLVSEARRLVAGGYRKLLLRH